MSINEILTIVTLIAALGAVTSAIIAVMNRKNNKIDMIRMYINEVDSKTQRDLRAKIRSLSENEIKDIISNLKENIYRDESIAELVCFYDKWGHMVGQKLLPIQAFESYGGISMIEMYEIVKDYILYRRVQTQNRHDGWGKSYGYYFEKLYNEVKAHLAKEEWRKCFQIEEDTSV